MRPLERERKHPRHVDGVGHGWERVLLPLLVIWLAITTLVPPWLLYEGYDAVPRYLMTVLFAGGALLCLVGYSRYWPWGRKKVLGFLILLVSKSFATFLLGIAFFILAASQAATQQITWGLLAAYCFFGMSGGALFFNGIYVLIGASRGWILQDVYKNPFSKEKKQFRQREQKRRNLRGGLDA